MRGPRAGAGNWIGPPFSGELLAGPTASTEVTMPARDRGSLEEASFTYEVYPRGKIRLSEVDLSRKVEDETYEEEVVHLQERAYALQIQNFLDQKQTAMVFEGWDAAGKGGAIKRLTALMDPRGYKVWPIGAPRDEERRNHWMWRFWTRLPEKGELVIFDRSWYGRVLVERVERYARPEAWRRAYDEINTFERALTAEGVRLVKFFLHIDRRTQLERFKKREKDPIRRYKLGEEDWRNRRRWPAYEEAVQEMLDRTHRPDAPWVVVAANDKKSARLEVLRTAIRLLEGKRP
jgi:polyphosphate kinase 2 (PPK2 family)